MWRALAAAAIVVALGAPRAWAEDRLGLVVSPGAMGARSNRHGALWDAELSAFWAGAHFGLGGAVGGNPDRTYLELQPVAILDLSHDRVSASSVFLGVNPGIVFDYAHELRRGAQVTLWGEILAVGPHGGFLMLPLVPFARAQLFAHETVWSFGFMLKLPIPIGAGLDLDTKAPGS
jgi:hypothetical protein